MLLSCAVRVWQASLLLAFAMNPGVNICEITYEILLMSELKRACFPLACQIIKRGCNVNDRDGLTDMTLLHYTCKSGAHGIGE